MKLILFEKRNTPPRFPKPFICIALSLLPLILIGQIMEYPLNYSILSVVGITSGSSLCCIFTINWLAHIFTRHKLVSTGRAIVFIIVIIVTLATFIQVRQFFHIEAKNYLNKTSQNASDMVFVASLKKAIDDLKYSNFSHISFDVNCISEIEGIKPYWNNNEFEDSFNRRIKINSPKSQIVKGFFQLLKQKKSFFNTTLELTAIVKTSGKGIFQISKHTTFGNKSFSLQEKELHKLFIDWKVRIISCRGKELYSSKWITFPDNNFNIEFGSEYDSMQRSAIANFTQQFCQKLGIKAKKL
ncbi:hypothetical protein [Candidatus Uabimicrobium sp. HlEnr_7]|uniref:hypothetical protein n=1 Tax=Candidatus Uabimicrobium helgolandensis TaxID=3095367 RepID=UPI00355670C4